MLEPESNALLGIDLSARLFGADQGSPLETEVSNLEQRIVATNVSDGLRLTPIPLSRVIEISYISSDREMSAQIANAFANQYIRDQLQVRLSTTRAATNWLASRVEELRVRVQEAELAVAAARTKQSNEAGQSLEITRQQLAALINTYSDIENASMTAQADYMRLRTSLEDGSDLGTVPEFNNSEMLSGLAIREMNLRNHYTKIAESLPQDHYSLAEINEALRNLETMQKQEAARIVEVARTRWLSLDEQTRRIQSAIRDLDRKTLQQAEDELNIRQLEREADASRRLYETFLERLNDASEQVTLESADARILTFAEPPLNTYSQPTKYAVTVAFIAGLMIGTVLVYLRVRFSNTFRSVDEVEKITGADVIGMTPAQKKQDDPAKVFREFSKRPNSRFAEAIHGLRTSILLKGGKTPPKVVLFTSSHSGEGKSLLAALTALSAFRINQKTVIVDCDLLNPNQVKILNGGLVDQKIKSVADTATPFESIRVDHETGLHVLAPDGIQVHNGTSTADILSSQNFSDLITRLRDTYDLVVLDAPPSLIAVDARVLSKFADSIVYVTKWNKTARDAVLAGLRSFELIGAPVSGVVLSMVKIMKTPNRRASNYGSNDFGNLWA
ncbi:MAG: P-loop NTPase [Pseudomonadota bacterium]